MQALPAHASFRAFDVQQAFALFFCGIVPFLQKFPPAYHSKLCEWSASFSKVSNSCSDTMSVRWEGPYGDIDIQTP